MIDEFPNFSNMSTTKHELSYILNHLGEERSAYHNAVSPPIFQTSNFTFANVEQMRSSIADEMNTPFYTRGCNPTVQILRKKVAALEGAEDALIFASGIAAMTSGILACVENGDHIVSVENPYSWTNKFLTLFLPRYGIEHTMIDGKDAENFRSATKKNTKLFILESPNSLTFELQDLKAVCDIAKSSGIKTILDNSYATPLNQNAIDLGVDLVAHSASKYYGGHSDIVAGVLCGSFNMIKDIFASEFMNLGGIVSPFDAWLMIRGLRTLPLRLKRSEENTAEVVKYLEQHPKVEQVYFPYLESNPQYALAKRQMKTAQGLFSVRIKANELSDIDRFCDALKYFILACSWGGHESLIFPMAGLSDSQNYKDGPAPWNLIRFYVGLEDPKVLIQDLDQAFNLL